MCHTQSNAVCFECFETRRGDREIVGSARQASGEIFAFGIRYGGAIVATGVALDLDLGSGDHSSGIIMNRPGNAARVLREACDWKRKGQQSEDGMQATNFHGQLLRDSPKRTEQIPNAIGRAMLFPYCRKPCELRHSRL